MKSEWGGGKRAGVKEIQRSGVSLVSKKRKRTGTRHNRAVVGT